LKSAAKRRWLQQEAKQIQVQQQEHNGIFVTPLNNPFIFVNYSSTLITFLLQHVQTIAGAHQAFYSMVCEDSSQEIKRPESETDNNSIEWVAGRVCALHKDTQLKTTKPEGTRPLESDRSMTG